MQSKIFSRRTLLIVASTELVIVLLLVVVTHFIPKNSANSNSISSGEDAVVSPIQTQPSFGLPLSLKIPTINVDAKIEYVGLTAGGEMDIPKSPDGVAWLELGPRPGEIGSAVVAGHYGVWKNGAETVFNNLKKLQIGDKIFVEDEKGASIPFVVRESRIFDPKADASSVFSSNDGKSHLNLVTCESWDKASESYSQRLVVFTDKE